MTEYSDGIGFLFQNPFEIPFIFPFCIWKNKEDLLKQYPKENNENKK